MTSHHLPRAIRPAFKAIAMPQEGYGDAGNILLLRNWNAYMHLVAGSTFVTPDNQPTPAQIRQFYELAKRSGILSAAAVTAFVYGREVSEPRPGLRGWQWRDDAVRVSYFVKADAKDIRPERQLAPHLVVSVSDRLVADNANHLVLPGKWMGKVVDAAAYAGEHVETRRRQALAPL